MAAPTFFIGGNFESGAGFQVGDTFTVNGGSGTAVGTVLAVDTTKSNTVTSVSVAGGTGYSAGWGVSTTATSGLNAGLPGPSVDILVSGGVITQGQVYSDFAGFGWAVNDTGHLFISAGVRNAVFKVLTVNAFGSILTVSITTPGSGYPANRGMVGATNASGAGVGGTFQITTSGGTVTAAQIQALQNGFGWQVGDTAQGFVTGYVLPDPEVDIVVDTVDTWGGVLTYTVTFTSSNWAPSGSAWPYCYFSPSMANTTPGGNGVDLSLPRQSAFPSLNVCSNGPAPSGPTVNGWLVINEPSIGYTDRSSYLFRGKKNNHSWSNQVRQRGPATIPLWVKPSDSYTPVRGTPCFLMEETPGPVWTIVFAGLIQDIEYKNSGKAGYRLLTVTALSLECVLDTVYADGTDFFENETCGFIVKYLLCKYETGAPIGLGTVSDGVTMPLFSPAKGSKISELIDQLASTSLFTWGISPPTQLFYFTAPATIPAPFALTNANVLWDSIAWKVNGADYRNRQAVKLADAAFSQSGEFFAGSGQQSFTLMRPVKQVVSAYVTIASPNYATLTFTGQPSPGDTFTIGPQDIPWSSGTYLIGTVIVSGGYVFQVTFAGTSGSSLPTFNTVTGATTTDGSVIWTCLGPYGTGAGEEASSTYTYVLAAPALAWVPNTAYTSGQQINANGFIQQCTTAGTTGGNLPAFNATGGGTTADGTVVWTNENPCLDNTQPFQIAIGVTLADSVQNGVDAINATAPYGGPPATQGRGCTFSLPTWEGAQVNAALTSGTTLKVTNKQAALIGVSSLAATSSNFSWSGTQTAGGSFPQGSVGPNEAGTIDLSVYPQGTSTASPGLAYQQGSAVISLATPLNSGTNLNVWYTRADGGSIEVENTSLVQSLAAISHGTGKYQQTTDQSSQGLISTSALAGLQLAQQILEAYSVTPTSFEFKTYYSGLFPGMTLTVTLTAPLQGTGLLNGEWVIETVQGNLLRSKPYFGLFGHYVYTVKMVDIQEIDSWLDFWKGMATGGGSSGGVSGGPLVATSGGAVGTAPSVVGSPPIGSTDVSGTLGFLAGATLVFKSGSNDRVGSGTLAAGTLAVGNTSVTANSLIFVQALGGGVAIGALYIASQTAGTGFTVQSTNALDTQNFQYFVIETD